ncbi:6774_t:CDS:2, partial [Scutellospora calospora]
ALKEIESNKMDSIKNLECTLMNLNSELSAAKDSSNASDERCSNIINELENKLKNTLNIQMDKEENITNLDVLISEFEFVIQKPQSVLQTSKAHSEAKFYRDQVLVLENQTKQLESDRVKTLERDATLEQQVEQLQKDLEILCEEFLQKVVIFEDNNTLSNQQKQRIVELETVLAETKKAISTNDRSSISTRAKERISELNAKINILESELVQFRSGSIDINEESVESLKSKIQELQSDKDILEQANSTAIEDRNKLAHKIDLLMHQLRSVGGNKVAQHISQLNEQIIKLEKEHAQLKQDSLDEIRNMEKEITHLIEHNSRLEQEIKGMGGNVPNIDKIGFVAEMVFPFILRSAVKMQQSALIKTLQERIVELENRSFDEPYVGPDLDAVGGMRMSTMSSSSNSFNSSSDTNNKKNQRHPSLPKPSVPPPNQPFPPIPQNSTPSRTRNRSDSIVSSDLSLEIQRLHKKIAEIEGENLQNLKLVETLEASVGDNEIIFTCRKTTTFSITARKNGLP